MSRTKLVAGALAAALLAWLIAPQLFTEFASIREKVVRTELLATGDQLRVPILAETRNAHLRSPFAAISRIRNDTTRPLVIHVAMDGQELCSAEIPPGDRQRLNCTVRAPWSGGENHNVLFSANSPGFTVEYLELATHYGALSTGPRNVIVVPEGSSAFQKSSPWHIIAVFVLLTLSAWSVRHRQLSPVLSVCHLVLTTTIACVVAAVIASRFVSPYALLISDTFLESLLFVTALPALLAGAYGLVPAQARPRALLLARAAGVGLLVGCVFMSFAAHRIAERFAGNASGMVLIAHRFFDKSPMAERDDIRQSLVLDDGGGYDGQFFYFMTFDPFLTRFRHDPHQYREFIDAPPYRYGRIGFSLLTKILSGDRPARYPITMVALVIASLALCGALLASIAQYHGRSVWYGVLIVVIPGFWQSVEGTLPEPLAVALFLAAYWCLIRQRWWACGTLLGMSMLVRETTGALVLAVAAGFVLAGKRREGAIVALLAFVPIVLWKGFLGWVFWSDFGMEGVMPHPNDVGLPFGGVWDLWTTIARGEYFPGWWPMTRAGLLFPLLTTAGAALALWVALKRPSPIATAALFYALLTITFNYQSVWLDVGNAQRLSIDLFVALALVFLQSAQARRSPAALVAFWCATAGYVFFGTYDAAFYRGAVFGLIF